MVMGMASGRRKDLLRLLLKVKKRERIQYDFSSGLGDKQ